MRAALGANAFSSIRSLMLRQQSTYAQQLFELHNLSQVQEQLMLEMQLQGFEGDGDCITQLQLQPYRPQYSSFSLDVAHCRETAQGGESGCGVPQPSSSARPQAHLAHLRRIVRSLGNLPKAMRGKGRDHDASASTACPPLPPLPPDLLRPLAVGLPPADALLGDGSTFSLQPTVQQMGQNHSVSRNSRGGGRSTKLGAIREEEEEEESEEEKSGEEGSSQQRTRGDDLGGEGESLQPSCVSLAMPVHKVSRPTM